MSLKESGRTIELMKLLKKNPDTLVDTRILGIWNSFKRTLEKGDPDRRDYNPFMASLVVIMNLTEEELRTWDQAQDEELVLYLKKKVELLEALGEEAAYIHKIKVTESIPTDYQETYLSPQFIASGFVNSIEIKDILRSIEEVIMEIYGKYSIRLSYENVWKYAEYIKDNPRGDMENIIDSYLCLYNIDDIQEAIKCLPIYNQS